MKITPPPYQITKSADNVAAGGVTVVDSGGYFTADDLEDILAEIGAGTSPGAFLRTTLGGVGNVQALGTLGATETIDLANANYFWGTLDQDCAITTTGWTNLKDCQISVEVIGDGTSTPTFTGWTWIGTAPGVIGAGDVLHVVGISRDGGTTIYGAVVGGGGSAIEVLDEGVSLTSALTSMDFVGPGVEATAVGDAVTVTVPGATAAAVSALGFVGAILISDTPSTPLVFADLIQNEAQDDLVYADV